MTLGRALVRAARNQIFVLLRWDLDGMNSVRAIRYRRLALAEEDKAKADLLLKLADECDQGLLCTAEWRSSRPSRKTEQPPKAGDANARFEWNSLNDGC
jgi:hypothetical protein